VAPWAHPCKKAYDALKEAGHSPDVVKAYGFASLPDVTSGRRGGQAADRRELRSGARPGRRRGHQGLEQHRGLGARQPGGRRRLSAQTLCCSRDRTTSRKRGDGFRNYSASTERLLGVIPGVIPNVWPYASTLVAGPHGIAANKQGGNSSTTLDKVEGVVRVKTGRGFEPSRCIRLMPYRRFRSPGPLPPGSRAPLLPFLRGASPQGR
jgi:hypothetical protein